MKISVSVKPNAKVDEIVENNGIWLVKTKEPAHEGRANKAVIELISRHFHVPRSAVRIVIGLNNKNKVIEIAD